MGRERRIGIWLVGCRGSVATTVVAGVSALGRELVPPVGCVTELPPFRRLQLPAFADIVFGGHDIVDTPLLKRAEGLVGSGVLPPHLLGQIADELAAAEREMRPGPAAGPGAAPQGRAADGIILDLTSFRRRHDLDTVVVVNVSSTEAAVADSPAFATLDALRQALDERPDVLPPSSLYAYAAFSAGCPFIDFTPSTGARLPALAQLARTAGVPYAGRDGKTGETLVKSVLAPMFACRALQVRAWSGTNLLGGGDGAALDHPEAALSKSDSKQRVLTDVLGPSVEGTTHIDNVPALGEWKTAWDHIRFDGFLGTAMTMQFIWQGCDSALAAPLVLDLARLVSVAHRAGWVGPLPPLGFFFKDPDGDGDQALDTQYRALLDWVDGLAPQLHS
ncbi:myo-inositol-1-phosphate synthase [Streptomyces sp. SceaMP-e96]|uniref:inositol-3-phosphate synthase n=1 Tax=Streptomyces TaxID=1883 RepID=UPI000823A29B|nr:MULTISPECIES: inositol-3-phosphate synthase [unclassified Streptomyces]MYT16136.1 myo-inositol-1-phosphate synthase [Streptomyces sp. SID4951]SCK30580.1 myo-inositol-1-phosphate synthase [Streptomyces sp. SceaMP-e96]